MRRFLYPDNDKWFWHRVNKTDSCWLWTGHLNNKGYGMLTRKAISNSPILVHRYSWLIHHGVMPIMALMHTCDTPQCVNPDHLEEGSQSDNMIDAALKDRKGKKLDHDKVRHIRNSNLNAKKLADKFDVSEALIYMIRKNTAWRYVA